MTKPIKLMPILSNPVASPFSRFPATFGLYVARDKSPEAIEAMSDSVESWWSYFFLFKNGDLGVSLQNADAPLRWDSQKKTWVTGRQMWFDDFVAEGE